jgi:hypothetical protein
MTEVALALVGLGPTFWTAAVWVFLGLAVYAKAASIWRRSQ